MKTPALSKLNVILIATFVLAALPSVAYAAYPTVLARGAGYGEPNGSLQVELLQHRLRRVGVNPGPIDGRFGPLTEAAVRRYQLRDGLMVDGLAGPQTRTALRRAVKLVGRGAGYGMPHGSARIRRIQRSLRLVGARPGPIDGRFGAMTEAAVVRFQHSHGLAATGLAGAAMLVALGRQARHASVAEPPARTKPAPPVHARSGGPKRVKVAAGSGGDARPAKAKPAAAHSGGEVARIELILFAAALLLAIAALLGLPEKVVRRIAGPPPPAPTRALIAEDVEPDPAGKVVDGSRRPPRPRPPAPRTQAGRGNEPERRSSTSR